MTYFLNACRFTPTLGGLTDWTYASAVLGYQSPASAGVVNGATYHYRAESADLSQWEYGDGVYNTGTGVLTRATVRGNSLGSTAKINFGTVPTVSVISIAEDLTSLTGFRIAKTAAYTVSPFDQSGTIALAGAAQYALTFGAASAYASPWAARILNEDLANGKQIVCVYTTSTTSLTIGTGAKAFTVASGLDFTGFKRWRAYSLADKTKFMAGTVASYASTTLTLTVDAVGGSGTLTDWQIAFEFILYPKQSIVVENQNNLWQIYGRQRYKMMATQNLYVDNAGANNNDGMTLATAYATPQAAVDAFYEDFDGNGYKNANHQMISLLTGGQGFTGPVTLIGQPTGCNVITIKGNGSQAVISSVTDGVVVGDGAECIVDTLAWNCNSGNTTGLAAIRGHNNAIIDLVGPHLFIGNGVNCAAIYSGSLAMMSASSSALSFSGTFGDLIHMDKGGTLTVGGALTPSGTVNTARAYNLNGGAKVYIGTAMVTVGWTSMGASIIDDGSSIHLNGTTIQGGTSLLHGGQAF